MIAWLIDTLIATGFLMGLVLLIRRPVARLFGPGVAYALWALPLIRLILPPLMLPASFAPKVDLPENIHQVLAVAAPGVAMEAAPRAEGWSLAEWSIAVWLCGALALLVWRAWSYAVMRRRLLDGARPMGEADNIRIVESRAVAAPVAFGVFDKLVALPWGFMACPDRRSRNFALEHEFEHHAGRDLIANLVFQPLLALHWFNPLAWLAWRAMRRDQEAACDARVMAGRSSAAREAYARLIAGYAAGPRLALLAAPMACPVLGEKSIVQRLKCLARPEISARRRKAGGALLAASALALPLTATISYAEAEISPSKDAPVKDVAGTGHFVAGDDANEAGGHALTTGTARPEGVKLVLTAPEAVKQAKGEGRGEHASVPAPENQRISARMWVPAPPVPPVPPIPPVPHLAPLVAVNLDGFGHDSGRDASDRDCSEYAEAMVDRSLARKDAQRARVLFKDCTRRLANAHAIEGLREAREDIEADSSMPESIRRDIIEKFDRQIASLSRHS